MVDLFWTLFLSQTCLCLGPGTQIKVEKCEMRLNVELHVVRRRARHVKQFKE